MSGRTRTLDYGQESGECNAPTIMPGGILACNDKRDGNALQHALRLVKLGGSELTGSIEGVCPWLIHLSLLKACLSPAPTAAPAP